MCVFRQRQYTIVLQQYHTFLSCFQSQCPVFRATHHLQASRLHLRQQPDQYAQYILHGTVYVPLMYLSVLQQFFDVALGVFQGDHHLKIQSCPQALLCIPHSPHEIAHHKAIKAPFVTQDICQQLLIATAMKLVVAVVGAHYRQGARLDTLLEMRQIHLMQRSVITFHVHIESQVLNAIERIMLGAGYHALLLHALGQGNAKFTQHIRVFAIALLRPSPAWVTHQVDTHATEEVGTLGNSLCSNRLTNTIFQISVKSRSPQHGNREASRFAHHHASRTVGKQYGRHTQTLASTSRQSMHIVVSSSLDLVYHRLHRTMSREHIYFLVQGHLIRQSGCQYIKVLLGRVGLVLPNCLLKVHIVKLFYFIANIMKINYLCNIK